MFLFSVIAIDINIKDTSTQEIFTKAFLNSYASLSVIVY